MHSSAAALALLLGIGSVQLAQAPRLDFPRRIQFVGILEKTLPHTETQKDRHQVPLLLPDGTQLYLTSLSVSDLSPNPVTDVALYAKYLPPGPQALRVQAEKPILSQIKAATGKRVTLVAFLYRTAHRLLVEDFEIMATPEGHHTAPLSDEPR